MDLRVKKGNHSHKEWAKMGQRGASPRKAEAQLGCNKNKITEAKVFISI